MNPTKTDEPIEMPFEVWTWVTVVQRTKSSCSWQDRSSCKHRANNCCSTDREKSHMVVRHGHPLTLDSLQVISILYISGPGPGDVAPKLPLSLQRSSLIFLTGMCTRPFRPRPRRDPRRKCARPRRDVVSPRRDWDRDVTSCRDVAETFGEKQ